MMLVMALSGLPSVVEAHTRTVKINVSKKGFSPSTIEVEKGHLLNLVFTRTDRNTCTGGVSIPKINVRKTLPLKKDVVVSFMPNEAGEITFTCGNLRGKIIVADD